MPPHLTEYRKHIEKDAALERRFQTVLVDEPTVEDAISILRGLRERFEVFHGVKIQDSALVAAAVLSHRYITDRFLPDKAIDLVDEGMRHAAHRDRLHARRARRAHPAGDQARDRGSRAQQGEGRRQQEAAGGAAEGAGRPEDRGGGDPRAVGVGAADPEGRAGTSRLRSNACIGRPRRPSGTTTSTELPSCVMGTFPT